MFAEKEKNEYGKYLYRPFLGAKTDRSIVFLHDYLSTPEFHDPFCDGLNIFNYYGIYLPYYKQEDENGSVIPSFHYLINYVKDLLLSFNSKQIFLIGEGIGGTIALALANLMPHIIKKIILVNPLTSLASVGTLTQISNIPKNPEESLLIHQKMFYPDDPLIRNKLQSPIVINTMRRIYYNYEWFKNLVTDIMSPKTLEAMKMYEENLAIPTLLLVSENDELMPAIESIYSLRKNKNVKIVQIPNTKHFPIHDVKEYYQETILKFFIDNLGLNSAKMLPNKYVYHYLSDEWKKYYRTEFGEKLSQREYKEYLKKLEEYEKDNKEEIEIPKLLDDSQIQSFVEQQAISLKELTDYVDYNQTLIDENKRSRRLENLPDILIDYTLPPHKIVVNKQGFEVYHDGHKNAFYRDYNGQWKPVPKKE